MQNIRLQKRDQNLTSFLRAQGFATFEQLERMFFVSKMSCSKRLRALEQAGYIRSVTTTQLFKSQNAFMPILLGLNLHPLTRIYSLSSIFRKQMPETNRLLKYHICMHQLLLNDVRNKLDSLITDRIFVLNDPQLKAWSLIDAARRKEFTPDLSYESGRFSIAIELERTMKSMCRYAERFGFYQNSAYSHILYVYVNEAHLQTFLKYAGTSRRFAFCHYLDPELVFSNTWGFMKLNDWIEKIKSI